MKRFLKNNQYQLNSREQEEIWRSIQQQTGRGSAPSRGPRRFVMPVFGMTAVTAAVLMVAVWFHDQEAPQLIAVQALHEVPLVADSAVPPSVQPEVKAVGKVREKAEDKLKTSPQEILGGAPPAKDSPINSMPSRTAQPSPTTRRAQPDHEVTEGLVVNRDGALPLIMGKRAPSNIAGTQGGSVTGGTTPPNGETFELMYFEHTGVNPFVATEDDALSTFAVDVDNASYTLTRSYLQRGVLPPSDAVRVEEFVNFFPGGYPEQTQDVFTIHTDGTASRFGSGYQLLRVGLKGKTIAAENRKPANLIFVIDISGSMSREDRLGLVKQSLLLLLDQLAEGDRVGIVTYGNQGEVVLEPTDISRRSEIERVIQSLGPSGATNACEGLDLAYDLARRNYDAGVINRLILCSDGVANLGDATRAEEMLARVRRSSDEGITLSTIGFGMGNYNDVLMENLADQGDGNYNYVDKLDEAERVFHENLTGLLQTIAGEVKIQVEFDPRRVQRWRLLGYENRDVADRDFRNDSVDAGEVGAGHEVTALYELKLIPGGSETAADLGTVRVRFAHPSHETARAGQVEEITQRIRDSELKGEFSQAAAELRLQAVAAEFAEILRGSFWAKESRLADLVPLADGLAREMAGQAKVAELAQLIRQAADLQEARQGLEKAVPRD